MKKLAFLLFGASLGSNVAMADSNLIGNETLLLTPDNIFEIYKDNNIVYDQLNMPNGYNSEISAIFMTLNKLQSRLMTIKDDVNRDYLYSGRKDDQSRKELIKMIGNLDRISNKLQKLIDGFVKKPNLIDKYYSLSVSAVNYTNKSLKNTEKMISESDIQSGYANELNLISTILNEIAQGYKDKTLKLILERGDITGKVEKPYAETLNFKF